MTMAKVEKKKYENGCIAPSSETYYPYGTSLNFEDGLVEVMGIEALAPGDKVSIRAYAFVESTSEYANESDTEKNMRIQITDIAITRNTDDQDNATKMYGG